MPPALPTLPTGGLLFSDPLTSNHGGSVLNQQWQLVLRGRQQHQDQPRRRDVQQLHPAPRHDLRRGPDY